MHYSIFNSVFRACLLVSLSLAAITSQAQDTLLPSVIKMVVPFPPGASNDVFARLLSEQLANKLGVTVLVENKPGAGGLIGSASVARATPDGSTLLFSSNSFVTRAVVDGKLPFDARTSFMPVAMVAQGAMLLVVNNETPYKSVKDLIADSKKNDLNYGSAGVGSIGQMSMELFNAQAGINMTHIPYKGISSALTDMIGGRIQSMITTPASVGGAVKGKQIRALAVTSTVPSKFYPDLPTVAASIPGFSVDIWWGVYAPAKTPDAVVAHLNKAIREVTNIPKMRELFAQEASERSDMNVKEFTSYVDQELTKWQKLAKERNIKLSQ